jgi:putative NIF3 family GTP cyclohydrolase 1 type 2
MTIQEVIDSMKAYHKGEWGGKKIDDETTRDKVLYGDTSVECTGIVTTCWATVDVIKKAAELGANLIISHEALFWNHGDHTDWLKENHNETFEKKSALLDEAGIAVWRDHDYIHSGIPVDDGYVDGIFYGVGKKLGWDEYMMRDKTLTSDNVLGGSFEIPETTVGEVAHHVIKSFNLEGAKVLGDLDTKVKRVWICGHVFGVPGDNDLITRASKSDVDLAIALELTDYTFAEYILDSGMLGLGKTALTVGHFNLEEPGMEYMLEYIHEAIGDNGSIPCTYVQSGDNYHYVVK